MKMMNHAEIKLEEGKIFIGYYETERDASRGQSRIGRVLKVRGGLVTVIRPPYGVRGDRAGKRVRIKKGQIRRIYLTKRKFVDVGGGLYPLIRSCGECPHNGCDGGEKTDSLPGMVAKRVWLECSDGGLLREICRQSGKIRISKKAK